MHIYILKYSDILQKILTYIYVCMCVCVSVFLVELIKNKQHKYTVCTLKNLMSYTGPAYLQSLSVPPRGRLTFEMASL